MARDFRPMVGNLISRQGSPRRRAEPGDLCAGTRMAWSDGQPTSGSADVSALSTSTSVLKAGDAHFIASCAGVVFWPTDPRFL